MKKLLLLSTIGVFLISGASYAQDPSKVKGGPHDLSAGSALTNSDTNINGQTCIFCHSPHGGTISSPLWNRTTPAGGYTLYTSSTMWAAKPTTLQTSISGACMSCHDGSIGMDVLADVNGLPMPSGSRPKVTFSLASGAKATYDSNNKMTGGLPLLGLDLQNDHPVNILYETARAGTQAAGTAEYVQHTLSGSRITVPSSNGALPLYGTSLLDATVECASCHNAHDNSRGSFLRTSNQNSAMCLTCHQK